MINKPVILILISLSCLLSAYKFPKNFKRCHVSHADFDKCLAETIENAVHLIGSAGIPSLKLLPIDPISVTKFTVGEGPSAVKLEQHYNDAKLCGLSKIKVGDAHSDLANKILNFTFTVDSFWIEAKYEFEGKVLLLPVYGNGDANITLSGCNFNASIKFTEKTKANKKFFEVDTFALQLSVTGAHYYFGNLFNGNKELSDTILKVINENWSVIYGEVIDGYLRVYEKASTAIANGLFNTVPIDEIFLK